jgi:hypothetical protein
MDALLVNFTAKEIESGESICTYITMILLIESFAGIMFTSAAASLFFGKIMQLQRNATVQFSDICVIRTSEELIDDGDDDDEMPPSTPLTTSRSINASIQNLKTPTKEPSENPLPPAPPKSNSITPFPVLEFRLVNTNFGVTGSQILRAELSVSVGSHYREGPDTSMSQRFRAGINKPSSTVGIKSNSGHIRYYPLVLELPMHPLFNKIFYGRHTLDLNSPLLTRNAKRQIKIHTKGRGWPRFLNSGTLLRDCIISFESIIVCLSGIEVSGGDVYSMTRYSQDDMRLHGTLSSMYDDNDQFDVKRINDFCESEHNELAFIDQRTNVFNFIKGDKDKKEGRDDKSEPSSGGSVDTAGTGEFNGRSSQKGVEMSWSRGISSSVSSLLEATGVKQRSLSSMEDDESIRSMSSAAVSERGSFSPTINGKDWARTMTNGRGNGSLSPKNKVTWVEVEREERRDSERDQESEPEKKYERKINMANNEGEDEAAADEDDDDSLYEDEENRGRKNPER